MKAEFVKRLKAKKSFKRYQEQYDILVYRYRGIEYYIDDIPQYKQPAWYMKNAHREEQRRIDLLLDSKPESEMTISADECLDYFMKLVEN